jgi:type III secretory pathway component EscT
MDASAWIALTSLALVIFVQAGAIAFVLGGLFRDVKTLREQSSEGDCRKELAVLNTRFAAMEELVKELGHDIKNLLTGQVVPARRVRAARD